MLSHPHNARNVVWNSSVSCVDAACERRDASDDVAVLAFDGERRDESVPVLSVVVGIRIYNRHMRMCSMECDAAQFK